MLQLPEQLPSAAPAASDAAPADATADPAAAAAAAAAAVQRESRALGLAARAAVPLQGQPQEQAQLPHMFSPPGAQLSLDPSRGPEQCRVTTAHNLICVSAWTGLHSIVRLAVVGAASSELAGAMACWVRTMELAACPCQAKEGPGATGHQHLQQSMHLQGHWAKLSMMRM